jgi:hypothetical protein
VPLAVRRRLSRTERIVIFSAVSDMNTAINLLFSAISQKVLFTPATIFIGNSHHLNCAVGSVTGFRDVTTKIRMSSNVSLEKQNDNPLGFQIRSATPSRRPPRGDSKPSQSGGIVHNVTWPLRPPIRYLGGVPSSRRGDGGRNRPPRCRRWFRGRSCGPSPPSRVRPARRGR